MLSRISIIIPAYNEENSIGLVLNALPRQIIHEIIVVDNGSTDETARVAIENGARVVKESKKGYGSACLKGIERLDAPDIVVFLDGDFSDFPEEIVSLIDPIEKDDKDTIMQIFEDRLKKTMQYNQKLGLEMPKLFPPKLVQSEG